MNRVEAVFEKLLWSSRFVVIIAVVASLLAALVLFFTTTWDVAVLGHHALEHFGADEVARAKLRTATVAHVVEAVDGYLLATFLLIFAFGLYELFISDIDAAKGEKAASRILVIETLDDLKSRLAKVILMILIVRIFEKLLQVQGQVQPDGQQHVSGLEVLYASGSLVAVGLALWLSHLADRKGAGEGH